VLDLESAKYAAMKSVNDASRLVHSMNISRASPKAYGQMK